jgi:ankyrin repeat protein
MGKQCNVSKGECNHQNKADLNMQDEYGWTALHGAIFINNISTCMLLINHGIDIMIRDNKGFTALDYALALGCVEIIKLLQEATEINKLSFSKNGR